MRVSVLKDDPGYREDACWFKAFLNGKELDQCITADEEKGEALCHRTDEHGNVMVNHRKDGTLKICFRGDVRLEKQENK